MYSARTWRDRLMPPPDTSFAKTACDLPPALLALLRRLHVSEGGQEQEVVSDFQPDPQGHRHAQVHRLHGKAGRGDRGIPSRGTAVRVDQGLPALGRGLALSRHDGAGVFLAILVPWRLPVSVPREA